MTEIIIIFRNAIGKTYDTDRSRSEVWAPLILSLMTLIVVMICCCFMRIDPSAPHSDEIDAFRRTQNAKHIHEVGLDDFTIEGGYPGLHHVSKYLTKPLRFWS